MSGAVMVTNLQPPLDVGTLVASKYQLERLIGRGGMGQVWMARHTALASLYAIKFLECENLNKAEFVLRFEAEAKITSSLSKRSRHIVSVIDFGDHHGTPYLVMELLDGKPLNAVIEERWILPPEEVIELLSQVSLALTQAHRARLIHRDLKPANIFVCEDEHGSPLVKVLDFGLVRSTAPRDKHLTQEGMTVGTPAYMSPEQARALPELDEQCDLWAMAVVAYEMLTGKTPWLGETVPDVLLHVCNSEYIPPSVRYRQLGTGYDAFFARAFHRDAKKRFSSAEALIRALGACVGPAMPLVRLHEDTPEDSAPPVSPRTKVRTVAVSIFALLLVVVRPAHHASRRWLAISLAFLLIAGTVGAVLQSQRPHEASTLLLSGPPGSAVWVASAHMEPPSSPKTGVSALPVSRAVSPPMTALAPPARVPNAHGAHVPPVQPGPSPTPAAPSSAPASASSASSAAPTSTPLAPVAAPAPEPSAKPHDKGEVF